MASDELRLGRSTSDAAALMTEHSGKIVVFDTFGANDDDMTNGSVLYFTSLQVVSGTTLAASFIGFPS